MTLTSRKSWTAVLPDSLLTPAEMGEADAKTIAGSGGAVPVSGRVLMEQAGRAITEAIAERWPPEDLAGPVTVACGPGNNGGDGFVVARLLSDLGYRVTLSLSCAPEDLQGDAALAAAEWIEHIHPLDRGFDPDTALFVDALLGAGLDRDVSGVFAVAVAAMERHTAPVVAVDIPSGVDGATGQTRGVAARAALTVTFGRRKRGHLLFPGRALCGEVVCADIGLSEAALATIAIESRENTPALWSDHLPALFRSEEAAAAHKYNRGHVAVVSGPMTATGAARLAAHGALRAGAGLVTLLSPPEAVLVNAAHLTAVMLKPAGTPEALAGAVGERKINGVVAGPGMGVGEETRAKILALTGTGLPLVLDADALTSFAEGPDALFNALPEGSVLTPHDGEFGRLFPDLADEPSKVARAQRAAARAGATVLIKGADTVIAAPDARTAINANAPPWLATAGAGDVLAGIIAGFRAQGMPAFEAACAGVWVHGAVARLFGPGLIAEDLPQFLPRVLETFVDRITRD